MQKSTVMEMSSSRCVFGSLFASVLVLAACGANPADDGDGGSSGGPDGGSSATGDGGAPGGDEGYFIIFGNKGLPCSEDGCPAERNHDLFRVDFDPATGEVVETRLTDTNDGEPESDGVDPDDEIFHGLSDDGQWILTSNSMMGARIIYRLLADGTGELEAVTPSEHSAAFVTFGPGSDDFYYVSDVDGDTDLYRATVSPGQPENVTDNDVDDYILGLIPGRTGLIIGRGRAVNDPDNQGIDRELYALDFATGEAVQLTDDQVINTLDAITPDGEYVIYHRSADEPPLGVPDGNPNLWIVPVDGSAAPRQVTEFALPASLVELMAITPDGSTALVEARDGKKQVYSVALTGDVDVQQLTDPSAGESSYFRMLGPDGDWFLYTSNDRPGGYGDIELYSMKLDGSEDTLLTTVENESHFLPRRYLASKGTVIIDSPIDGDGELFALPLAGGDMLNLTSNDVFSDQYRGITDDEKWMVFANLSDDFIINPDGLPSEFNDMDFYVVPTDKQETPLQLTENRVTDNFFVMRTK